MVKIISSGSHGNAVLYNNSVLVDIGVTYSQIVDYKNSIQLVLLTHEHTSDHLNISALKKLAFERPTLRIGCGQHMLKFLDGFRNVDVYEVGKWYDYGTFKITPISLYHDVINFGYRLFFKQPNGEYIRAIHCTDTVTLDGIEAKGYDFFCIESNYDEDTIYDVIAEKEARGEYAYEKGSINSHLSEQKARDFIYKNKNERSQVLRLHEHSEI